jgi:hypothetical protein
MNGVAFEMFIRIANQNAVLNQQALLDAIKVYTSKGVQMSQTTRVPELPFAHIKCSCPVREYASMPVRIAQ